MERRRFIGAVGAAAAVGLAGCLGDGDSGPDTSSQTAVVESWYRTAFDTESSEIADVAAGYYHSESPVLALLERVQERQEDQETEQQDVELESIETEITQEGLSEQEIEQMLTGMEVSGDVISQLVNEEETAQVRVNLEQSGDDVEQEQGSTTNIVVTEDGDWQIFL